MEIREKNKASFKSKEPAVNIQLCRKKSKRCQAENVKYRETKEKITNKEPH